MNADFILQAFDRDHWCPVLEARLAAPDPTLLRTLLGADAAGDPDLSHGYDLDAATLAAVVTAFGVAFDPTRLAGSIKTRLFRARGMRAPYLIHTGYELPLLLDGRKKLARFNELYPPGTFPGEHRFDHWVAQGALYKEEILEPFGPPHHKCLGMRTVHYTPVGEEWRIPATKLLWEASEHAGGWNPTLERLEGMLFGYARSENDWWLDVGLAGGGFPGISLCCAVTQSGLNWLHAAGLRAVPPPDTGTIAIARYDRDAPPRLAAHPGASAIIAFDVARSGLRDSVDLRTAGPWMFGAEDVAQLNRHLTRPVRLVAP